MSASIIGNRVRGPMSKTDADIASVSADTEVYEITQLFLKIMKDDSEFFKDNSAVSLPKFEDSEVSLDMILGRGEFGVVYSIGAICTTTTQEGTSAESADEQRPRTPTHEDTKSTDDDQTSNQVKVLCPTNLLGFAPRNPALLYESNVSKKYMSENLVRDGQSRYAVKRLREDFKCKSLVQAMADLTAEASFLMCLRHPNICKMRGTIGEPGKRGFAIVMDRLIMTLRDKMVEWKAIQESGSLVSKVKQALQRNHRRSIQKDVFGDKIVALYDVSRSLRYLAKNRIIFRDLKPENVGVDVRGDFRLFDFGLAKELKEKAMTSPGMYQLTGLTGSRRYMAPEVIQCKDYGLSADVYSFAIMAWEVLSNRTPYPFLRRDKHFEMVVQRKKRPNLKKMVDKKAIPEVSQMHALVNLCWSHEPTKRPSMDKVCEVLFAEVLNCGFDESSKVAVDRSKRLALSSLRSRVGEPLWA